MRLKQFEYAPGTTVCQTCKRRAEREQTGGADAMATRKSPFDHQEITVEGGPHLDPLAYLEEARDQIYDHLEERLSETR